MKKALIALVLAISSLTLNAKDITKNNSTGAILCEIDGIYSVRGWSTGVLILGDAKTTLKTLTSLDICFAKEGINKMLDTELSKEYEVHRDKDGHWYVICLKAGGAKLYASDVNLFLTSLSGRELMKGIGKAGDWVSKKSKEILK